MSVKTMVLTNRALIVALLMRTTDNTVVATLLYLYIIVICIAALAHTMEDD